MSQSQLAPEGARRALGASSTGVMLLYSVLISVACSHQGSAGTGGATTGSGGNSSGSAGSASTGAAGTTGVGGTAGNSGASGTTGAAGGGVVVVDAGSDGMMTTTMKTACVDDPNQQHALAYTPGYSIAAADKKNADDAVSAMDLNTKVQQLYGPNMSGYDDIFRTADVGNIKGFQFRDGPRGVDLDPEKGGGKGYVTAFPVASARGATFDLDLENKVGSAMGDELIAAGATMLLAPTVNILRHPAWGRAQETYGEDSFALGRLGSAFTVGVQQYAPACAKHFAANNIEKNRAADIAKMDEQTLQEVYARHYGMIVQDGGVACVMAAYNLIASNGTPEHCTQDKHLLNDILRTEFGFQGMVLSDWWAMPGGQGAPQNTWSANASEAINAGLDMELPWRLQFTALPSIAGIEPAVTTSAQRVVETKFRFHVGSTTGPIGLKAPTSTFSSATYSIGNNADHIALAEQAAIEGSVLLKNDNSTLPIKTDGSIKKIAIIGTYVNWNLQGIGASGTVDFANDARIGDLGSSRVDADPAKAVGPCSGFKTVAPTGISVTCANSQNMATALSAASGADFIVLVAGLTPEDEGEEYTITPEDSDRDQSLALDGKHGGMAQNNVINQIVSANSGKPIAVVLEGGSAIDVSSWIANVPALVMAWYPGQSGGTALGKLMFGKDTSGNPVTFSGKLPITWPAALADEPPFSGNGGDSSTTIMSYYLGYRWFDTQNKTPLYAFGHGLSYATFSYSNLQVPCSTATSKSVVNVSVDVTNTGTIDGDEIVFLFVNYPGSKVPNRVASYKELKGFQRATIKAGQTVRVTIPIRVSDLWYYDVTSASQKVDPGMVKVMVGGSSDKLPLSDTFVVQ
jgi:beta-glucosidase